MQVQRLGYSSAEAPEMISMSSRVITAWRVRLKRSCSELIMSPAYDQNRHQLTLEHAPALEEALSMADMRALCSEEAFSSMA